ncbi:MAG: PQQ-binding-like beta-propeller repeat protein [Verrucomicrobia bacterium]|nr:PQQ-binding-like beta-propeller repeat protein [Verrucomicrobiota bacterium]
MKPTMKLTCTVVLAAFAATSTFAGSPAWPMFRGPNGSGVSTTAKPPVKFGPKEAVLWQVDVPWSPSSPCVWGERIYLSTFADGQLQTRAYRRADGKLLWTRVAPHETLEEYHQTAGSPASATPATDGKRVVSYFGSSGLVCYDVNGKELWQRRLPVAKTSGNFGSGTSPFITGDRVILNRDLTAGSSILAVSLKTGKKLWETPRPDSPTSYGTPILWRHDGLTEIVMAGSISLKTYAPSTGAERWLVRGLPCATCTTPVLGGEMLFFAGWGPGKADAPMPNWEGFIEKQDKNRDGWLSAEEVEGGVSALKAYDMDDNGKLERTDWNAIEDMLKRGENSLLAIKPGGKGDVTATHVAWKFERGLPYVPSPLYYQGRVYLVKDGGMMSSLDAKTGQAIYTQERLKDADGTYYASPVAADGRIYVTSLNGKLTVVKAGGDKPEILHQADFGEHISATPALVEDNLYLRTQTKLYAIGS